MNASPLPRLTVSREKAKKKIRERITEAERLALSYEDHEDRLRAYESWSEYNETLLASLFEGNTEYINYKRFTRFGIESPLSPSTYTRIRDSVSSLESICEQIDLYEEYSETSNMTQHSFGNDVFIVHGRDDGAKDTIARFVEHLGIQPIILHERPSRGETIIEKIERYSDDVGFAIVLITPDDVGGLESEADDERNPRPRQNVVFELGYFMGKLGRERVCPLFKGEVETPSDIDGIVYIDMDAPGAWKETLRREINAVIEAVPGE